MNTTVRGYVSKSAHPVFASKSAHFENRYFPEKNRPNSANSSLPMGIGIIHWIKNKWWPNLRWLFRNNGEEMQATFTQSINQPSYHVDVCRLWGKNGVRRLWGIPSYCMVPRCSVTFWTHPEIIPVGQFFRRWILRSRFLRLIDWLTESQFWLDWFIGFVPHDLFLPGAGLKWPNTVGQYSNGNRETKRKIRFLKTAYLESAGKLADADGGVAMPADVEGGVGTGRHDAALRRRFGP